MNGIYLNNNCLTSHGVKIEWSVIPGMNLYVVENIHLLSCVPCRVGAVVHVACGPILELEFCTLVAKFDFLELQVITKIQNTYSVIKRRAFVLAVYSQRKYNIRNPSLLVIMTTFWTQCDHKSFILQFPKNWYSRPTLAGRGVQGKE